MTDADRFNLRWSKQRDSGCWVWTGARTRGGYGTFYQNGKHIRAHRYSYVLAEGEIPEGMWVLHRCDNPPCVNPDHLFLGTRQDNVDDMVRKGRHVSVTSISDEVVGKIKGEYSGVRGHQTRLAEKYGISQPQVSRIVRGKSRWKTLVAGGV